MKYLLMTAACIGLAQATPAAAAEVSGDWSIEGTIGQMPLQVICSLKEADQKLTGSCHNEQYPDLPLAGESHDGHVSWTYTVNYQGQQLQVTYAGQLESPTSMKGDILVGGNPSGSFTAHKPAA
jgi:hypothetical protein